MDPETQSAGSASLQQMHPPSYQLADTDSFWGDDDGAAHSGIPRATTTPQPKRGIAMSRENMCDALASCNIIPAPVQSALDFVVDLTQLIIPSLFMPSLSDECLITAAILDGTGARSYVHARKSPASGSVPGVTANPPLTQPQQSLSIESDDSTEPGDTYGFDLNKNDSDFRHAVAVGKSSATAAEIHQFSAPPSSTASDIDEPSAPTLEDLAAVDARLLDVNQLLLRRIRKLELTNQIIREAYSEVQEMLQAERQSKTTQLKSLERKHEEDMEKLVQEYQDRADRSCNDESECESSSESESDGDYAFHPGFSTLASSSRARVSAGKKVSASNESSPVMNAAKAGGRLSPLSIRRTVSDTACLSASAGTESFLQSDLGVEFLPGDAHDSATDSDTDSGDSGGDDDDDDDDVQSEASWVTDDDGLEYASDSYSKDDYDGITFSRVFVHMVDSEHSEGDLDTDSDTDGGGDSESDDDADEQLPNRQCAKQDVDDGLIVDPAQAVFGRYYAQTGVLSIAADIDDIPADGYEGVAAARSDEDSFHHSDVAGGDFAVFDEQWQSQGVWDAIRGRDTDSGGLLSEEVQKSVDERELELISSLPADQRIAKFVCRASSHLQQGARGGLSLGFMMHNIEALSDRYSSNHQSVLCAFIECLYRIAETILPTTAVEASLPPSALAKHVRSEAHSSSQVVLRIIKLMHSFISIPEDQVTVLKQLEQLSEANRDVRLAKHALLLRMLYDNELVDKASLLQWYSAAPAPGLGGQMAEAAGERGRLLRLKAAPLLIEASSGAEASSAAAAISEMCQQVIVAGNSSSGTASASSTPNMTEQAAARGCTGNLTPVSDENATLHSQSSDCEGPGGAPAVRSHQTCRYAGILGIGRKAGSHASLGETGADRLRPAKQVKFAAVVAE
ncbi:hypothetical protein IWW37_000592 [Coemansia sp. RSA 2050]|nr:hypothetical protein IWW37_000592 [Coemansia sp. RSA 2050]